MEKISFNQKIGYKGERIASKYLLNKGFELLHNNWRYKKYEIDVIAFLPLKDELHFIEVKTRTNNQYGQPEEYVTQQKIKQMQEAAQAYITNNMQYKMVKFDIVSILLNPKTLAINEILMIEDVYAY